MMSVLAAGRVLWLPICRVAAGAGACGACPVSPCLQRLEPKDQAPAFSVADPAPEEQLIQPATIRRHRVTHGHLTSTACEEGRLALFCQMGRDIL